ncbi:putative fatty acyl-CoA reductase CG5065 [Argiope bruennichi]|uniref:putative fatty acyl-CoA reductase CG5065 n=1 Tax=Argiope bruennichi TaxID=94029 RepID=UPI00249428F7|nr:putative fatty acyl-CoA reductase CG5065 [Argiope bruennichi]XP_055953642.1 putative fatty acyl-CoA reductase CG5065 [Argiope bruennichi]
MLGLSAEDDHLPRVADFYHNKSVFITGSTGFVGSLLLETLLRCCPGVKYIYILLRSKKNVTPEDRKQQIFSKKIFDNIKEANPELLSKVHVISGDVALPNLGMSEEDIRLLLEEVSIVFHCAANVSFTKPLKFMFLNVILPLNCIIKLCRRMKKFQVLVYTSTAYSNCNHLNSVLKEEVYRLPFRTEKFLDAFKNEDNELLDELVAHCKPDWPNTYTFCKCLAENLIMDTASDLPIAIMRPSIIVGTLRNPMPASRKIKKIIILFKCCHKYINFFLVVLLVIGLLAKISTKTKERSSMVCKSMMWLGNSNH